MAEERVDHLIWISEKQKATAIPEEGKELPLLVVGVLELVADHERPALEG